MPNLHEGKKTCISSLRSAIPRYFSTFYSFTPSYSSKLLIALASLYAGIQSHSMRSLFLGRSIRAFNLVQIQRAVVSGLRWITDYCLLNEDHKKQTTPEK